MGVIVVDKTCNVMMVPSLLSLLQVGPGTNSSAMFGKNKKQSKKIAYLVGNFR